MPKLFDVGINLGKAVVTQTTAKGIKCRYADETRPDEWVPRSALHYGCQLNKVGDRGDLRVWAWFLEKTGRLPIERAS